MDSRPEFVKQKKWNRIIQGIRAVENIYQSRALVQVLFANVNLLRDEIDVVYATLIAQAIQVLVIDGPHSLSDIEAVLDRVKMDKDVRAHVDDTIHNCRQMLIYANHIDALMEDVPTQEPPAELKDTSDRTRVGQ